MNIAATINIENSIYKQKPLTLCISSIVVHADSIIQCASATSVATSWTSFVEAYRQKFWRSVRYRTTTHRTQPQGADATRAACFLLQES